MRLLHWHSRRPLSHPHRSPESRLPCCQPQPNLMQCCQPPIRPLNCHQPPRTFLSCRWPLKVSLRCCHWPADHPDWWPPNSDVLLHCWQMDCTVNRHHITIFFAIGLQGSLMRDTELQNESPPDSMVHCCQPGRLEGSWSWATRLLCYCTPDSKVLWCWNPRFMATGTFLQDSLLLDNMATGL